ncbi:MAG: DNA methyltransferase [Candidatus Bathyarchaeia archaeon]
MTSVFSQIVDAKPHTPVYTMHRYFARRPWNVFRELVLHYSTIGDIVLDPFCGGGVTVVESLKLGRKAIGVDANPLATYITEMECKPLNLHSFQQALLRVSQKVELEISRLYRTKCGRCNSEAVADWIEWDETTGRMIRLKYDCQKCGTSGEKSPKQHDLRLAMQITENFAQFVSQRKLWYPKTRIPNGDKTNSLLSKHINFFHELFTKRNALALSILNAEISRVEDSECRDFLRLAFSGSLKWASRQSHLRGEIVEGWAMHAYWVYPRSLEINVWNTFRRRAQAILRGKKYSNQHLGKFCVFARDFNELAKGNASCLILNQSSSELPFPESSVDAIITDPPYGGNVNYAELSDYWHIWLNEGKIIDKGSEVIINRTQGKGVEEYESLLYAVLKECYRVLKPNRCLVSTFNSRDIRVVASFITGASKAGFTLHPDGLLYQNPIRPYTTTFHAMQIGAFVGDFVFTFVKEKIPQPYNSGPSTVELKEILATYVADAVAGEITEPQLRERAYRSIIPFLANRARVDLAACKEAVDFFEAKMKEREQDFRQIRMKITEKRRRKFRQR